jgi:outer membrane protein
MKKLIVCLLLLLPLSIFAQETKIAYVNTQDVIEAMPEFAEMRKKLQATEAEYSKELQVMQEEYQKKYSDFIAKQDSLTENIKMRRMQELEDLQQRSQTFVQQSQQDYQKMQSDLFAPIQEKLKKAIESVGAEKGYVYILDPQVIFYTGNGSVDATQFVKTKLGIK